MTQIWTVISHLHWQHFVVLALFFIVSALLNLLLSKKTQIDAWAEAQPRLAGILKIGRAIGFDPWGILQGWSLLITGKLPPYLKTTLSELSPAPTEDDRPTPVDHPPAGAKPPSTPPEPPPAA